MQNESPHSELARLRREQFKTRQDEVFGGLSLVERAAYKQKELRIQELERSLSRHQIPQDPVSRPDDANGHHGS